MLGNGRATHAEIPCDAANCLLAATKDVKDFPASGIGNGPEDNVTVFAFIRNHTVSLNVTKWFPCVKYDIQTVPSSNCAQRIYSFCVYTMMASLLAGLALDSELSKVMVQMFVHEHRPLVWREPPKKAVGMGGASVWAGCGKPIDQPT